MKNLILLFLFFLICVSTAFPQTKVKLQNQQKSALNEVVATEKTFSAAATQNGTKAAFIEFAADNATIFNPKPVNAKEAWQKRSANQSLLFWQPAWADISENGDFGYTTGPWGFSQSKTEPPVAFGEYVTIWKRQSDGKYKFVLDIGIRHGETKVQGVVWDSPKNQRNSTINRDKDFWRLIENKFAAFLSEHGVGKTYQKFASEEIRLLREKEFPFVNKEAALRFLAKEKAKLIIKSLGGDNTGQFTYSYGEYEIVSENGPTVEKGHYLRIWKYEEEGWRIALDLANPLPPENK